MVILCVSAVDLLGPVEYPDVRSFSANVAGHCVEHGFTGCGYVRIWTLR